MSFPEIESIKESSIFAINNLQTYMQTTYNNFMFHLFWYYSICFFAPHSQLDAAFLPHRFLKLRQLWLQLYDALLSHLLSSAKTLPKIIASCLNCLSFLSSSSTQPMCSSLKTPEQHIRDSVANLPGNAELSSLPVPAAREDGALHPVTSPQVWTKRSLCSMEGRNKETGKKTCLFGVSSMKSLFGSGLGRISCFLFVSLAVPPNYVTYVT